MKREVFYTAIVAMFVCVMMTACGGSKQAGANYKPASGSPFGEVYEAPCSERDSDDEFAATGIASGSRNRMDVIQTAALTNAQNIVRQKMQHAYKGAIDDYSNYIGNNAGSDAIIKVERAGTQLIDQIVNNTKATCGPKFSAVDAKGDVTCFVGIRVSNKKITETIIDHVSNDEELKIRFNEEEFRKRMETSFEKFKEGK